MDVNADSLTRILADRLAAIVPAGFHVRAADGMLWYSTDEGRFPGQPGDYQVGISGTYVRDNLAARGQSAADNLAGIAAQALSELQDYVDEATRDPWPGERTPPRAYAQIRGPLLHLWYGGPDADGTVVLACEPIPLTSLQLPASGHH